jgi:hypothetical protein
VVALALLLLATMAASSAAGSGPKVKVVIELFQVALVDSTSIRYLRREAVLDRRGPDTAVAGLLHGKSGTPTFFTRAPLMVHSTSWRYQDSGAVVLTYLAYGEELNATSGAQRNAQTIQPNALPGIGTTDPDKPRPSSLAHLDVLAHGLRHLALLARRPGGDKFALRLGERSRKFFSSIEPELAGEIGNANLPAPSSTGARQSFLDDRHYPPL